MSQVAEYGSWRSPLNARDLSSARVSFGDIAVVGQTTYWIENRPAEKGRAVIVSCEAGGEPADIIAADFNARSCVHEYGGGSFTATTRGVYFINFPDQSIWFQPIGPSQPASKILAGDGPKQRRFADFHFDAVRNRIICVCEQHSDDAEPVNFLAAVTLDGRCETLAHGADFYASATLSPDGRKLAWLSWDHPQMPWDGTELWIADVGSSGNLENAKRIAGGPSESIFQPQWSPDGRLHFVSDQSDWWNLYRFDGETSTPLKPLASEFGLPQWVFGMSTYGFDGEGNIICAYGERGYWNLARLDRNSEWKPCELPFTSIDRLRIAGDRAVFCAGSTTNPTAIVNFGLTSATLTILRSSSTASLEAHSISAGESISFPSAAGREAHAFYYPPMNAAFIGPETSRPPLLVKSHGGPTASTSASFDPAIQYWTTRGFAVVDVNYGGSTGYGRPYRELLNGRWGEVDVEDCVAAAQYLIADQRVDPARCAIRGNSAGGYTTLAALTFADTFQAGASYYGISDLEILARDTHKFESRYLDKLIGPYPASRSIYQQRSPLNHCDNISAPVIFFQGALDNVVPVNQAEQMAAALKQNAIPVALIIFADEHHGFRQASNVCRSLESELYFYSQIFGFELSESIDPVEISNWDQR